MDKNPMIVNPENSLFELPRQPPPCSLQNIKQVRFMGPKPSGDLELSAFESPRALPSYNALPVTKTVSNITSVNNSSQTDEFVSNSVDRACQTDQQKMDMQLSVPMSEIVSMIQRQDKRMDSLHEKLELILSRIDEGRVCSCGGTPSGTDACSVSPPALDNVLGQVEIMLNSPRPPMVHNESTSHRVDQSAAFDALAMKYLRGEEVGRIKTPKRETDVSLATAAYLQKHRLPH